MKKTQKQIQLFNDLHLSHVEDAKVFIKPQYRSLFNGVIDKYSDSAHCLYELLQNADDANATKVELILKHDKLIFIHNGNIRFTISDPKTEEEDRKLGNLGHINSITSIGFSTKNFDKDNSENKIGKFGVGFKAIFQYTTTPYIYDDPFCFKIENFIIPTEIDDDKYYQKGKTTFVIPFDRDGMTSKQAYDEIEQKIFSLDYPQLFLHNVRSIVWETESSSGVISKKAIKRYDSMYSITPTYYVLKNTNGNAIKVLLMKRDVTISDMGTHSIAIGYFLDSRGRIDTSIRPKIHCFFPTAESIDTCYVIHAPFALVDNREQIKKDNKINTKLFNLIGLLAAQSILVLREISLIENRSLLNDNILDLMHFDLSSIFRHNFCYDSELTTPDFNALYADIYDKESVFLSKSGNYIPKNVGCWSSNDLQKILSTKQLTMLLNKHASIKQQNYDFILCSINTKRIDDFNQLGIHRFTDNELASSLTSSFMEQQDIEWLNLFYEYILTKRLVEKYTIKKGTYSEAPMRYATIIQNEIGYFVAPYTDLGVDVYFNQDGCIPPEKAISNSLYENCPSFSKLLDRLEIKSPSEVDFIRLKIGKQSVLSKEDENDLMILIVKTFYKSSLEERVELIKIVNTKYLFACKKLNDRGRYVSCRQKVKYICKDDRELVLYFTLSGSEQISFLDVKFYSKLVENIVPQDLSCFLSELDFIQKPSFNIVNVDLTKVDKENRPNYRICSKYISSIDGINNVLSAISGKLKYSLLSHYIWNLLSYYADNEPDLFVNDYSIYHYYSEKKHVWPICTLKTYLRTDKWLAIGGKMKSLNGKVYTEELLNNGYQYNVKLFEALGIESSPRVKERASIAQMSAETNEIYLMGEIARQLGVKGKDEMQKLITIALEVRQKQNERKKLNEIKAKEHQELVHQLPQRKTEKVLSEDDFKTPNNEKARSTNRNLKGIDIMNLEEALSGFEEKISLQKQEFEDVLSLRDTARSSEKYSYLWMKSLMELETKAQGKTDANGKKAIILAFDEIVADTKSENLIILRSATRTIPSIIEDIDEIPITFFYKDNQKVNITFDVASVKDDCLILKGNSKHLETIKKVKEDVRSIYKATLEVERPIELIKYWERLIQGLNFTDDTSLKSNLRSDLNFIFGPPGTGKTTELAKRIIRLIEQSRGKCKILVLAPTNKACDVLTEKILDSYVSDDTWLWRFVSTMSERIENEELVYDRSSDISLQKKVCVISTIARYSFDGFDTGLLNQIEWDYVIVDEASMIPLYQIIPLLYNDKCKNILIAGDPFQIEPIVQIDEWKGENIYSLINLHDFVVHSTEPVQFNVETLMTQYRSIPVIGEVYSQYMYGGKLCHNKSTQDHRILNMGLKESPLNIINYPISKETIFEAKHLGYSNIHIYSVIFTVEFIKYLADNISVNHNDNLIRIGVLSPYGAEVQAIQKMFNQSTKLYENIEVVCGTSHGFQGDECDIVIAVMNPPASGLKRTADLTFINKANILNVAISRAKDYLFVLIPSKDYECFDSLYEIKRLGRIMSAQKCKFYSTDDLEKQMFGQMHYIENNTFVTTHQTTNIYSDPFAKYEIRIDENAMDIQINEDL